jgi:hypothetical protein
MPKKIKHLTIRDGKIIAFDDTSKQWFLIRLEPLDLKALEKDELIEAVNLATGCGGTEMDI